VARYGGRLEVHIALTILGALLVIGAIIRIVSAKCGVLLKPPQQIQLVPVDDRAKGRFADSHRRELESLGFTPIGIYQVREMPGVTLVAFANSFQAVCAVVYRHPLAGIFVDMCCMSEDGSGVTATTAPAAAGLDQPPGRKKFFDTQATIRQLYDRVQSERMPGPYQRLDASTFARSFETEYAHEMEWRKKRGGPTEAEVRREAAAMGIKSEKVIQKATEQVRKQYQDEPTHPGVR